LDGIFDDMKTLKLKTLNDLDLTYFLLMFSQSKLNSPHESRQFL